VDNIKGWQYGDLDIDDQLILIVISVIVIMVEMPEGKR
jgi:hypothetical protein